MTPVGPVTTPLRYQFWRRGGSSSLNPESEKYSFTNVSWLKKFSYSEVNRDAVRPRLTSCEGIIPANLGVVLGDG